MKKFMRFAMVLALAGSALLYSGCTKDYQKDIDDLNSGVTTLQGAVQKLQEQVSALEALKSQVASLQGDVAPLQAAINKNTEAIAKLQDGYVTKDELDTELASLKEETLDALAGVAIVVADNTEAIAALKEAYKKTDAVAEALNLGKIASVVLVPSKPTEDSCEGFKKYEVKYSDALLYDSDPILYLNYKVSPAALAASLDSENTVLHIYGNNTKKWVNLPVNILDADAETGLVSLFVDLDEKNFKTAAAKVAYSLEIDSVSEEGVVNKITSAYDFADVNTGAGAIELVYAADFEDIKVPYDKFATSERTFFEGIEFYLTDDDEVEWTLDEAAAIFDVDVEDITPTFKKALTFTESDYIKTDANAWTAKMKAEKLDDAKTALTNSAKVTATATAYITVDGITKNVWSKGQKYSVVNAEGNDITIDAASLKWTGTNEVSTATLWNKSVSKSISNAKESDPIYLTRKYKDKAGNTKYNVVKAYADDELATVVPCGEYEAKMPKAVNADNFAKIAFADKAQELGFIGTYIEDNTDYAVSFTLKLDPKPADKKNLDLGTFKVDGSYTKLVKADLGGILKALIGGEEDLYKNVKITVTNTANKLEAQLANELNENATPESVSVIKETAESSVEVTEDCNLVFSVPTADGNDKNKDKSTLEIKAPTENGETYVVFFDYTAFGVEYKGSFKVEVSDKGNFALKTTPFVQNGVIKVTYNNASPASAAAAFDGPVKLNKVDFADYFALTSAPENEDVDASGLRVVIDLKATQYKKDNANKDYTGTLPPSSLTLKVKTTGTGTAEKYTSQLETDEDMILDWKDFTGREIVAKAQLQRKKGTGYDNVGDAIEVKLQAVDPFRTFETKDLEIKYTPGEDVYINLVDLVKLTSNVDGSALTEFGSAAKAATKDTPAIPFTFSFDSHGLKLNSFGYINDKGKFVNFGDTIDVIVNGTAMPMNIKKDVVSKDGKDYKYMLTLPTSSALPDGSQIKFKLGLHTTNICQTGDDQVAEHSGDVTITLKTK